MPFSSWKKNSITFYWFKSLDQHVFFCGHNLDQRSQFYTFSICRPMEPWRVCRTGPFVYTIKPSSHQGGVSSGDRMSHCTYVLIRDSIISEGTTFRGTEYGGWPASPLPQVLCWHQIVRSPFQFIECSGTSIDIYSFTRLGVELFICVYINYTKINCQKGKQI